jgi:hypothetical protein
MGRQTQPVFSERSFRQNGVLSPHNSVLNGSQTGPKYHTPPFLSFFVSGIAYRNRYTYACASVFPLGDSKGLCFLLTLEHSKRGVGNGGYAAKISNHLYKIVLMKHVVFLYY